MGHSGTMESEVVPRGRVELYGYEGSSLLVAQKGKRWTGRGTGSLNILG